MSDPRVDDILDRALDLDPVEWPAFLDLECRGNGALRDEIESLLAVHVAHPDLLLPASPAAAAVPDRIGRYPIRREIARGGMGVVYEAESEVLGRSVALKVLPARLAGDPVWLRRFAREAAHLAAVEHPNIAAVHTLEEADGLHFLTMELVDDPTLRERLAERTLELVEALPLWIQIARALEALHRRSLVHCDLKPDNVLVSPEGHVTLVDFGLARGVDEAEGTHATDTERRTGTPGYMAPEQLDGGPVDPRTDLWAFGCLAYECVVGEAAFPGTPEERARATRAHAPDWSRLPAMPESVNALLAHCLRRERSERPEAIASVRRLLESVSESLGAAGHSADPSGVATLPTWSNAFVGRARETETIARRLDRSRLVTLTGPGGVGKTRLAVQVGRRRPDRGHEPTRFADLSAVRGDASVLATVAASCDVASDPAADALSAVVTGLRDRRFRLILDNCEHCLPICRALATRVLADCPGIAVIATSRVPLDVEGETVHVVPRLSRPDDDSDVRVADVSENESVALFLSRAAETDPFFRLTPENAAMIAKVCRRLEGIPLAIELAATRAATIGQEPWVAADDRGGSIAILDDVLAWSDRLLEAAERRLLRNLGPFAGFTLDAVRAIAAPDQEPTTVAELLRSLRHKSLVEIDRRPRPVTAELRFRLLDPVRDFANGQLSSEERASVRARHARYFLARAEETAPRLKGPDAVPALAAFSADHDNLRHALDHALTESDDPQLALRLAAALETFWAMRAHWREGAHFAEAALAQRGAELPTVARGHALNAAALFALHGGEPERADCLYDEALAIGRTLGDEDVLARSIHNKGGVALTLGRFAEARDWFGEYLSIQRRRGNRTAELLALSNLGVATEREGRRDEAEALYEQALTIAEDVEHTRMIGVLLNNLGAAALVAGRFEQARARLTRALRIHQDAEDRWGVASTRNLLGAVAEGEGDTENAARHFRESLRLMHAIGSQEGTAELLTQIGCFAAQHGEPALGAEVLAAAHAMRERIHAPLAPSHAEEVNGAVEQARRALGESGFGDSWSAGSLLETSTAVDRALSVRGGS
ncbi:MAG: protein kinase [bacterium]